MIGLLDVNVLVALVYTNHAHHEIAKGWLEQDGERTGWATCLTTELGAIRICALLPVAGYPPRESAARVLHLRNEHPRHSWWSDLTSPAKVREVCEAATAKQVPDRYLLGFARRRGARLVTFDRGLKRIGGEDVICLSPDADELRRYVGGRRPSGIWAAASARASGALTGGGRARICRGGGADAAGGGAGGARATRKIRLQGSPRLLLAFGRCFGA